MASWASIATNGPQLPAEPSQPAISTVQKSCAVIDTNALIDGSQLQTYGEQLATIPEVLKEVRDKKTRDYLERLPFQLQSMEPSPVSLRAGTAASRSCKRHGVLLYSGVLKHFAMCAMLISMSGAKE